MIVGKWYAGFVDDKDTGILAEFMGDCLVDEDGNEYFEGDADYWVTQS